MFKGELKIHLQNTGSQELFSHRHSPRAGVIYQGVLLSEIIWKQSRII